MALDALGNWSEFKDDSEDGSAWDLDQNRAHNKANEIDGNSGDPIWPEGSSGGWVDPKYDDAGNMIYGPRPGDETSTTEDLVMVYDAWNRLAAVYTDDGTAAGEKDASDTLIAEYRYDGRHRRIAKIEPDAAHSGKYVRTDYYYSLGWQVVEERRDDDLASKDTVASTLKYQYVWGIRYVDAPICRDEDTGDGSGGDPDGDCIDADDEHLYYTQDANFNVTALVDAGDGDVVERYMYSPYGEVTVLHGADDADGAVTEWDEDTGGSDWYNEILYCGYRFDNETGLYHVRHRYYHPPLGRWTSRDTSYADGTNLYLYASAAPASWVDPLGRIASRPPESDIADYLDKLLPVIRDLKMLKGMADDSIAGGKAAVDLARALATLREGNVDRSREALKDVIAKYGMESLKGLMRKAGAPGVMVTGIISGSEFGSSLGNFIVEKLKTVKRKKNCDSCVCSYLMKYPDVGVGLYEVEIWWGLFGSVRCYHKGRGRIFAEGPAPEFDAASDNLIENLIELFEKPEKMWSYCGDL